MKKSIRVLFAIAILLPICVNAGSSSSNANDPVADQVIAEQRSLLAKNTQGKGFGPQSPRDIDSTMGN